MAYINEQELSNYIGVDESPNEIYGKVMALADIDNTVFELLTDVPIGS